MTLQSVLLFQNFVKTNMEQVADITVSQRQDMMVHFLKDRAKLGCSVQGVL